MFLLLRPLFTLVLGKLIVGKLLARRQGVVRLPVLLPLGRLSAFVGLLSLARLRLPLAMLLARWIPLGLAGLLLLPARWTRLVFGLSFSRILRLLAGWSLLLTTLALRLRRALLLARLIRLLVLSSLCPGGGSLLLPVLILVLRRALGVLLILASLATLSCPLLLFLLMFQHFFEHIAGCRLTIERLRRLARLLARLRLPLLVAVVGSGVRLLHSLARLSGIRTGLLRALVLSSLGVGGCVP